MRKIGKEIKKEATEERLLRKRFWEGKSERNIRKTLMKESYERNIRNDES